MDCRLVLFSFLCICRRQHLAGLGPEAHLPAYPLVAGAFAFVANGGHGDGGVQSLIATAPPSPRTLALQLPPFCVRVHSINIQVPAALEQRALFAVRLAREVCWSLCLTMHIRHECCFHARFCFAFYRQKRWGSLTGPQNAVDGRVVRRRLRVGLHGGRCLLRPSQVHNCVELESRVRINFLQQRRVSPVIFT